MDNYNLNLGKKSHVTNYKINVYNLKSSNYVIKMFGFLI